MGIEEVKSYLRIDEDADDAILELMMEAARQYILDAVGEFNEGNFKVRLLFLAIMQDFYENRILAVKEVDRQRMAYLYGSIILQLQCEKMVGEVDGS